MAKRVYTATVNGSSSVINVQNSRIGENLIAHAESILIDNGIDPDDAPVVLQAIGYALLDTELYPDE